MVNILVVIVGALMVGVSVVLGVFAILTLGGLVVILAAVIGVRVWWLQRKMRKQFASGAGEQSSKTGGVEIIEGEYHEISTRKRGGPESKS